MTATFWRPASREWATMGCSSAMRWLLANRPQWSASTPRWPGRHVLWETLASHRHTSLWVVRARALGEPLEGHKQQQHQQQHQGKHSASTNTLNNERCSHLCHQRKRKGDQSLDLKFAGKAVDMQLFLSLMLKIFAKFCKTIYRHWHYPIYEFSLLCTDQKSWIWMQCQNMGRVIQWGLTALSKTK